MRKNDKEDSDKLAKLLRLNELPEAYLPPKGAESMRAMFIYRKSLGEDNGAKEQSACNLSLYGIHTCN